MFVSGGGSNLRALHDAMTRGDVRASVAVVVSNKPDCGGVAWARREGIPTLTYPKPKGSDDGLRAEELVDALANAHGVTHVLLAGYLRLIPPELCRAYENKARLRFYFTGPRTTAHARRAPFLLEDFASLSARPSVSIPTRLTPFDSTPTSDASHLSLIHI